MLSRSNNKAVVCRILSFIVFFFLSFLKATARYFLFDVALIEKLRFYFFEAAQALLLLGRFNIHKDPYLGVFVRQFDDLLDLDYHFIFVEVWRNFDTLG